MRLAPLRPEHRPRIEELLIGTAAFSTEEVAVALEVFDACHPERAICHPERSEGSAPGLSARPDYECIGAFAEGDTLVGYVCFGPTPATDGTYDLYWLAVDAAAQRRGVGRALVRWVEQELGVRGARLLVVETSSRADYSHTREFYARGGYTEAARVRDFYAPADDRIILTTRLTQHERGAATR